jgi:hypothetical protein
MLATLALSAALFVPSQNELSLTNVRPTYGILGAPRKDADALKLLPGDLLVLSFDIEGLKVADDGKVQYSIGMTLTDKAGKEWISRAPQAQEAINQFGGSRVPAFVASEIGLQVPPGDYTIKATVEDRATKQSKSLERKFEVVKAGFGVVRLMLSHDDRLQYPAAPLGVPGQRLMLHFLVVGFERDAKKAANLTVSMRVLENGKPVLKKEDVATFKDTDEKFQVVPISLPLSLNRPGKFTIELKVGDEIGKKSVTESFDLAVVEPK